MRRIWADRLARPAPPAVGVGLTEVDAELPLRLTLGVSTLFGSIDEMTGATGVSDGLTGLPPKPVAGDDSSVLTGGGVWKHISDIPGGGGWHPVLETEHFTATAGQTDFTLLTSPAADAVIYVTRDGVIARESDYTVVADLLAFGAGLDDGVEVQIAYWEGLPLFLPPKIDSFVAVDLQTDFTLSQTCTYPILVMLNGLVQTTTAWLIVGGTTLAFASGLTAGDDVRIAYFY